MQSSTGRVALVVISLSMSALAVSRASADWPMARHDVQRTATGDAPGRIVAPAARFRRYLGGSLDADQYVAVEVGGELEIVFISGGGLLAKTPDDGLVWRTDGLDLFRLDGLVDLDGDGTPEVIVSARGGRVYVARLADGTLLWSLPSGTIGTVGAVRFADFDGDGTTDLYVAEAACGATASPGDVALAFSYASGFARPLVLFQLEQGRRDYICGFNDTIADVDGDGRLEVVAIGSSFLYVYSTIDGSLESTSESVGTIPYGAASTRLADVDGDGRPELVCWTDNNYRAGINSRRVFVVDWDEARRVLVRRWERSVADVVADRHGWFPGGLEDLGRDGRFEVVTSFYDGAGDAWSTVVLNAASGAEVASVAVGPFAGLVDLDGDGTSEVLAGDSTSGLSVYGFDGSGLTRLYTAEGIQPLYVPDTPSSHTASAGSRVLAVDLDGDGTNELVAEHVTAGRADALVALRSGTDPPTEQARQPLERGVTLLSVGVSDMATPVLLTARSDGYLWTLDGMLRAKNADLTEVPPVRGVRIGGFYSGRGIRRAPVAADLDGDGVVEVLTEDSRGVLQRLSVVGATLVEPARLDWELPNGALPSVVDLDEDGTPEIVLVAHEDADVLRAIRAADARAIWSAAVGDYARTVAFDPIVGDVSGDGVLDVVYELRNTSGGTVAMNALGGVDGAALWPTDFETLVAGSGLGANALFDRDGDGRLDVLTSVRNLLWWRRGADGSDLGSVVAGYPTLGSIFDVDGDGADEVLVQGAGAGVFAFETDLTPLWSDTDGAHTRVLGAAVACPTGARFVMGRIASAQLTAWDGATGAVVGDIGLLDGTLHDPPSSLPDQPGVLGDVTMAPNLTGTGAPTALVPSTDGWLYAVDPCTMTLQWALDLRSPVGSPIVADIDGDGEDEVLVTVADGFLYGIDQQVFEAPTFVGENDGTFLCTGPDDDTDRIVTTDTLWANWGGVAGASRYEYAVLTPGGDILTTPSFIDVGTATEVMATGLPLRPGRRYLFAVRAIGPDGASAETLSDGVLVLDDACGGCGPGEICVDGVCVPDPCADVVCERGEMCVAGSCVPIPYDGSGPSLDGGAGDPGFVHQCGCCTVAPGSSRRDGPALLVVALVLGLVVRRRR